MIEISSGAKREICEIRSKCEASAANTTKTYILTHVY
jgi:hypothetical protein